MIVHKNLLPLRQMIKIRHHAARASNRAVVYFLIVAGLLLFVAGGDYHLLQSNDNTFLQSSHLKNESLLLPHVSSCNIACGGHAGNAETIDASIKNAITHKLKIGAHPSYLDSENFGRDSLDISVDKVIKSLREQLDLFISVINENNATLHHIKLHGALYNDVETNRTLDHAC